MYLEGKLDRMISMRVPVFTDLGLYLVGSMINCVRLRASSLDCRMDNWDVVNEYAWLYHYLSEWSGISK